MGDRSTQMKGFLAGFDVESLRARLSHPAYARLWERLRRRTHAVMAAARESAFQLLIGGIGWHSRTPSILAAALLYRIEGDQDALKYVEECIRVVDEGARELASDVEGLLVLNRRGYHILHSHGQIAQAADMLREALSPAAYETVLGFTRDVAIDFHRGRDGYLMYGGGNNIAWCHNVQPAICALLWGEACGHPAWREVVEDGIEHTRCYLKYGCDEAGYSYEGTGYGHGVFDIMLQFVQLLKQSGYADLWVSEPRLRAIIESSLQSLFPDQSFLTNDNDVGLSGAESMHYLLTAWQAFGDPLYLGFWYAYQGPDHPMRPYGDMRPWIEQLSGGGKTTPDQRESLFFSFLYWDPDAPWMPVEHAQRPTAQWSAGVGKANFRTSWGRDAVYLNVLGAGRSRMSQTHRHADAGHFSLFAHGDYLAIDTGRYNSDEDQHNVVIVDGKCHRPIAPGWGMDVLSGRMEAFSHTPLVSTVRVDMAHMKGCHWAQRTFLFVPYAPDDAYVIVLDNLNKDNARHSFWWQLQTDPRFSFTIDGEAAATLHGEHARLDLTFVIPSPEDFPDEPHTIALRQDVKEWHWPYGREQDTTVLENQRDMSTSVRRPRLIAEVDGLNGHILALVSPRRKADAPLPVRLPRQKRLLQVEIETSAGIDTVIAAPDHGFIETESVSGLTELALVRRDGAGRVLATWTVDGAPLTIGK